MPRFTGWTIMDEVSGRLRDLSGGGGGGRDNELTFITIKCLQSLSHNSDGPNGQGSLVLMLVDLFGMP